MQEAVALAERERESLMSMSPRKFEEFVAYLMQSLGFEVELTQVTRDGGADILCLLNRAGVPFRLAVEVKRYKEGRPVTVSLVRSFVGANQQFQANRLLYVTTSSYTAPATEFANKYASHFLTLKQYDQIQEWCREVRSKVPPLL
jgi:restriction system protein